jgi:hypothetical protein
MQNRTSGPYLAAMHGIMIQRTEALVGAGRVGLLNRDPMSYSARQIGPSVSYWGASELPGIHLAWQRGVAADGMRGGRHVRS